VSTSPHGFADSPACDTGRIIEGMTEAFAAAAAGPAGVGGTGKGDGVGTSSSGLRLAGALLSLAGLAAGACTS
jgi:hypothetical protein